MDYGGQQPYAHPPSAGPATKTDRAFDPRRKSPALACILSVMPGLGQIYVGYYKLGFIHTIIFGTTIVMLSNEFARPLIPLFGIFLGFFFLYNIVDAGRRAAFYNQALAGMAGVDVPSDMTLPSPGGSLAGGVVLIVVGFVLLSNTMFGIPWYWLEEWWHVAPIALGVYLFVRGLKEKAGKED